MLPIIDKIIAAHGGAERWNSLEAIEAEISVSGFLFTAKHVPTLKHIKVRAETNEPRFTFFDIPKTGMDSAFSGDEEVSITGSDGEVIEKRTNPRESFKGLRHLLYWDSLDFAYFGGYATWNYFMTPFIFLRKGFKFEEMETSGSLIRLKVTFPDDIPTHSKTQIFYFDEGLLLRRLDYTAEVVGGWAHAAHFCDEYKEFDGIKIPTKRRVFPMLFGSNPMSFPTLVAIDIHDVKLQNG